MAHIKDVAAFILTERGRMTTMKLQKLCYFSYGYHLVWEDRRLFPERFEAWANGPVSPVLYTCHRGRFEVEALDLKDGNPKLLDDGEQESVRLVLDAYGGFSAHELSAMTHRAGPWVDARERAHAGPLDRSDEELDDGEIFEFFDALTSSDTDEREG